jgi:hypothetical protein
MPLKRQLASAAAAFVLRGQMVRWKLDAAIPNVLVPRGDGGGASPAWCTPRLPRTRARIESHGVSSGRIRWAEVAPRRARGHPGWRCKGSGVLGPSIFKLYLRLWVPGCCLLRHRSGNLRNPNAGVEATAVFWRL